MARRGVMGMLGGGFAALLSGCGLLGGNSYRFRMTVEVETPQGIKTGSSVYAVSARKLTPLTSQEAKRSAGARGEATIVDLPGGPVFVLMKMPDGSRHSDLGQMSMAVLDPDYKNDWVESAGRIAGSWSTRRGEVPRADRPLMVRFPDLGDPKSVEKVDPEAVGLKRIVIETIGDDVTTGIEKRLVWLPSINGSLTRRLSAPDPTNPPFSAQLHGRDFSTEIRYAK